jgi:hypothetical protein
MSTIREDIAKDYRAAFFRYLPRREESPLASAYDIGRRALDGRLSLLDLAEIHHEQLIEVLSDATGDEVVDVARAGSEFFLEVLAAYDMAHRSLTVRDADGPEPRTDHPQKS